MKKVDFQFYYFYAVVSYLVLFRTLRGRVAAAVRFFPACFHGATVAVTGFENFIQ